MRLIDLTGRAFGRWRVVERAHTRLGKVRWLCRCECGEERTVAATALTRGTSKSCGCLKREASPWNFRHGESGSSYYSAEYNAWLAMRQRCGNPNGHAYSRYGGRGITICERWNSFEAFACRHGPQAVGPNSATLRPRRPASEMRSSSMPREAGAVARGVRGHRSQCYLGRYPAPSRFRSGQSN
jgi:hypothetical protein